jgi:hypothetical protein
VKRGINKQNNNSEHEEGVVENKIKSILLNLKSKLFNSVSENSIYIYIYMPKELRIADV